MVVELSASDSFDGEVKNTEVALAEIFADVLDVTTVGYGHSFVDLGGDSIAAALCVIQIEAVLGIGVPMEDLLAEDCTVAALARRIAARRERGSIE